MQHAVKRTTKRELWSSHTERQIVPLGLLNAYHTRIILNEPYRMPMGPYGHSNACTVRKYDVSGNRDENSHDEVRLEGNRPICTTYLACANCVTWQYDVPATFKFADPRLTGLRREGEPSARHDSGYGKSVLQTLILLYRYT